jgi:hypothetical protein
MKTYTDIINGQTVTITRIPPTYVLPEAHVPVPSFIHGPVTLSSQQPIINAPISIEEEVTELLYS